MIEFIDKTAEQAGTPLNRATLMALQGIQGKSIRFGDNTIIETAQQADKQGYVRGIVTTTTFNDDGSITVKVEGEKTVVKTITFGEDGYVSEVLS